MIVVNIHHIFFPPCQIRNLINGKGLNNIAIFPNGLFWGWFSSPLDVSITLNGKTDISGETYVNILQAAEHWTLQPVKRLCELLDNPEDPPMLQSIGVTLTERDSVRTL